MNYMTLELPLKVVFIVINDTLIGDRDKDFLSLMVSEVVYPIEDVVVETQRPF